MHLIYLVDGPDMHGKARTMCLSKEPFVDEGNLSRMGRNLKTVAFGNLSAQSETRSPKPSNALGAHGGADLVAEERPEMIEPSVGE